MTALLLASATKADVGVFAAAAVIVLSGAIGVVISANPVHSALSLVLTLFGVAILFVAQDAQFLAAVQVIVYAGAIVVLFLFVIMLIGVDRAENVRQEPLKGQRPMAAILGIVALAEILLLSRGTEWATGARSAGGSASSPGTTNVEKLAESIFTRYLFAFEITSILLIIAVVGAITLVRKPPPVPRRDEPDGDGAAALVSVAPVCSSSASASVEDDR